MNVSIIEKNDSSRVPSPSQADAHRTEFVSLGRMDPLLVEDGSQHQRHDLSYFLHHQTDPYGKLNLLQQNLLQLLWKLLLKPFLTGNKTSFNKTCSNFCENFC